MRPSGEDRVEINDKIVHAQRLAIDIQNEQIKNNERTILFLCLSILCESIALALLLLFDSRA